ncbi:hypothetical protein [Pseudomonas moorei]|jgi:hypothetical protein|uniref:hypothetical protein n=1 Tax=Pseudomonas moorei TaxID=395599 RepID=UPI0036F41A60
MHIEERLEFIDSLAPLPIKPTPRIGAFSTAIETPPHDPAKAAATVLPNTIDVYMPGTPQQIIDDVDLCKLIMQNDATKLYPAESQLSEWYEHYVKGLSILGWSISNKSFQEVTIERTGLTIDQVALDIAKGLIGADAAQTLARVGKLAVETLLKSPGAIDIFEKDKKLGVQTKFDIAPVWVDESGKANMILNCISLDARESKTGILLWKSTKKSTTVKTGAVRIDLNNKTFSDIRGALRDKYKTNAEKFIASLGDF